MSGGGADRGITVLRGGVEQVAATAAAAEAAGFGSVWTPEFYNRSAVVTLAQIASRTATARVGSSIAYAVGRSPLTIATEARSLDEVSGGRLVLGLGTGTRRMMSAWHGTAPDGPASRMEELVPLLRRLWRLHEGPVRHEGRFYSVDITPTAEIEPPVRGTIPVYTAGVNPRMVQVAGRVSDGLIGHPLFSPGYVEQTVRPAVARGAERAGRDPAEIEICSLVICAISDDEEQARREAAGQIAFYAAPKTYGPLLAQAGFDRAAAVIRAAFADGDHAAMVAAVPDEMVDALAVAGTPVQVRERLARLDGVLDHVIVYPPSFRIPPERCDELARLLVEHAS